MSARILFPICCAAVLAGCSGATSEFALPEGSVERGKAAFVELGCNACHSIGDIPHLDPADGGEQVFKELGGQVSRARSDEELVTSIINPSHKLAVKLREDTLVEVSDGAGRSRMRNYNQLMTVQQLIDITEFLKDAYKVDGMRTDYRKKD